MMTAMLFFLVAILLVSSWRMQASQAPGKFDQPEYVVLLHGMGRTSWSMKRIEYALKQEGYEVVNVSYHSRNYSIEELAENYLSPLIKQKIPANAPVHFVTHSLGGIIVRQYLSIHPPANLGKVVLIAPPNHGSEIIDWLCQNRLGSFIIGKSGRELTTSPRSLPNALGPVTFECGVIAGDCSANPLLSKWLTGPNDGKVTVESAKISGMEDFALLHATHTWMIWRSDLIQQTISFLQIGSFMPL